MINKTGATEDRVARNVTAVDVRKASRMDRKRREVKRRSGEKTRTPKVVKMRIAKA